MKEKIAINIKEGQPILKIGVFISLEMKEYT